MITLIAMVTSPAVVLSVYWLQWRRQERIKDLAALAQFNAVCESR